MAKLSARGRTKVVGVEKMYDIPPGPDPQLYPARKYKTQYVLMSDGVILEKTTWYNIETGKVDHDTGYRVKSKLKKSLKPEAVAGKWLDAYITRGWLKTL